MVEQAEQKQYLEVTYTCNSCLHCASVVVNRALSLRAILVRAQIHHAGEVHAKSYRCGGKNRDVVIYNMVLLKYGFHSRLLFL